MLMELYSYGSSKSYLAIKSICDDSLSDFFSNSLSDSLFDDYLFDSLCDVYSSIWRAADQRLIYILQKFRFSHVTSRYTS